MLLNQKETLDRALQRIFADAGYTPPSAQQQSAAPAPAQAQAAEPDLAAAIERARYAPGGLQVGELPRGAGVAYGPGGFATMGPVPEEAIAGLKQAGIPQLGALTAPPPPSEQDMMEQQMLKAATDAAKGSTDASVALKYAEMQYADLLRKKYGISYPESVARSRIFTSTPSQEAAMVKAIPTPTVAPSALNIPGLPPGVVAGNRPYWPPTQLVNPPGTTETAYQKDTIANKQAAAEAADRKSRREEILKELTSNAMLVPAMDASKPDKDVKPERKPARDRYLKLQRELDSLKEPTSTPPNGQTPATTSSSAPDSVSGDKRRVKVVSPDGRVGTLPASQVAQAKSAGWKVVE